MVSAIEFLNVLPQMLNELFNGFTYIWVPFHGRKISVSVLFTEVFMIIWKYNEGMKRNSWFLVWSYFISIYWFAVCHDNSSYIISGISTLSGCGSPDHLDRLPELPPAEEKRLRRAAQVLQQRLVLRQWLSTHRLQHAYTK